MGGASNVAFKRDPNIHRDFIRDFSRDFIMDFIINYINSPWAPPRGPPQGPPLGPESPPGTQGPHPQGPQPRGPMGPRDPDSRADFNRDLYINLNFNRVLIGILNK